MVECRHRSVLVESSGGPASHVLPLGGMLEASNWALPVVVSVFGLGHAFFDRHHSAKRPKSVL